MKKKAVLSYLGFSGGSDSKESACNKWHAILIKKITSDFFSGAR